MSQKPSKKKTTKPRVKRYRNEPFLKNLGARCRQLRLQKGYSIDRLSKESNQLSPASIDRLEKGNTDTHILVLLRYVETLGTNLHDLFALLKDPTQIARDPRIIPYEEGIKPSSSYVPVYSIKVAAGKFAEENSDLNTNQPPLGWIDVNLKGSARDYFAAFVYGESMLPRIADGDLCLFRKYSGGSRQGKIFLVQARSLHDAETGEAFVVKKYIRQSPPRSAFSGKNENSESVIHLISENPRFSPIILYGLKDEEIQTIAEFVKVI
jgi:transcriptional regulator with XRE-family HTH domain